MLSVLFVYYLSRCNHEYIDLYMEIEDPSMELIRTPFGGRICSRNIPVSRISMYETLVLAFYTDRTRVTPDLFGGTYEFIDAGLTMINDFLYCIFEIKTYIYTPLKILNTAKN